MTNLSRIVRLHAERRPRETAVVFEGRTVTFSELHERVCETAGGLRALGVGPGDRVAILMRNSVVHLELVLAIGHLGAVVVPLNYRLTSSEIGDILLDCGASFALVDADLADRLPPGIPSRAVDSWGVLFPGAPPVSLPAEVGPNDLFRLMYTSGTTGRAKGVAHTYGNVAWKSLDQIAALGLSGRDRLLVAGPMYHVGAFDLPGVAVLMVGGAWVVLREFSAPGALDAIEDFGVTGAWLAPIMLARLLEAVTPERQLASLRWIIGGGERTPLARIQQFAERLPHCAYVDAFGMTETCGGDTLMTPGDALRKIGSVGKPLAFVDVAILDDAGAACAAGQDGEIALRGPKVSAGSPSQSTEGAWFRTGDIGHLDGDGFLFLTDRRKDIIVSGGENIASLEVERAILRCPGVTEAAVVGRPDAAWGERPVAFVVLEAGALLSAEEVRKTCAGTLARFKVPDDVIFVPDLPRNPSGKVMKPQLRKQLEVSEST